MLLSDCCYNGLAYLLWRQHEPADASPVSTDAGQEDRLYCLPVSLWQAIVHPVSGPPRSFHNNDNADDNSNMTVMGKQAGLSSCMQSKTSCSGEDDAASYRNLGFKDCTVIAGTLLQAASTMVSSARDICHAASSSTC